MHDCLYNEALFDVEIRPKTPLLIKAGDSGEEALDPTLPNMAFVRIQRARAADPEVFIPGSSLRGVVRSHAEKLIRSLNAQAACDPTQNRGESNSSRLKSACFTSSPDPTKLSGAAAYNGSCFACKLFGNTALASRLRISDLYLEGVQAPLLARRYGVAIDRVTGAVAQGPFEIELLTDARFSGRISVRNFTLGQLALLGATLLDVGDGLVPMGYGKSRGLGRLQVTFTQTLLRFPRNPEGTLRGVGALVAVNSPEGGYQLPAAESERYALAQIMADATATPKRGFYTYTLTHEQTSRWLDGFANHWVAEVG